MSQPGENTCLLELTIKRETHGLVKGEERKKKNFTIKLFLRHWDLQLLAHWLGRLGDTLVSRLSVNYFSSVYMKYEIIE